MNKISKHFYNLNSEKINNVRIVLLSDIHYYNKKDSFKLNQVLEAVRNLKPNYICISGDMLDEAFIYNKDIIYNWLKELGTITKVIIGIGNHDLLIGEEKPAGFDEELFTKINGLTNVVVLDNQNYVIDNINFMGITLPIDYYYENHEPVDELVNSINQNFKIVKRNEYNVLLCHTPLTICKSGVLNRININNNLDLVLCGHTHGGITPEFLKPILKGVGLISPFRRLFFKYAYGHIKINNTNAIISSGITKASHRNRFHFIDPLFAREITVIDIDK